MPGKHALPTPASPGRGHPPFYCLSLCRCTFCWVSSRPREGWSRDPRGQSPRPFPSPTPAGNTGPLAAAERHSQTLQGEGTLEWCRVSHQRGEVSPVRRGLSVQVNHTVSRETEEGHGIMVSPSPLRCSWTLPERGGWGEGPRRGCPGQGPREEDPPTCRCPLGAPTPHLTTLGGSGLLFIFTVGWFLHSFKDHCCPLIFFVCLFFVFSFSIDFSEVLSPILTFHSFLVLCSLASPPLGVVIKTKISKPSPRGL